MKRLLAAALAAAIAGPAMAQEQTTLQAVTTRGVVFSAFGLEIPVTYMPNGRFTGRPPGEPVNGVWRIDGDKLCTQTGNDPEVCAVYPAGKKSGDVFEVPGAMGPQLGVVKVRIN